MVKRSLRFQTAQTLKSPILPASPRRFSSGSYEASNVPVLTVSIIDAGTGPAEVGILLAFIASPPSRAAKMATQLVF